MSDKAKMKIGIYWAASCGGCAGVTVERLSLSVVSPSISSKSVTWERETRSMSDLIFARSIPCPRRSAGMRMGRHGDGPRAPRHTVARNAVPCNEIL